MFGNKSEPSRFYRYGAFEPVEGLSVINDQMHKAHVYRNRLVELEIERRKRVREALLELSPELIQIEAALKDFSEIGDAARIILNEARARARERTQDKDISA